MKLNQIIPLLVLFSLVSGCSLHQKFLLYTPANQVPEGLGYDQSMRDHLAKLEKGPTVEGRACAWLHTSNAAVKNTMDNAYADAIQKAGPQYDALTNMDLTRTFYPLFFACNDVRGTATKNKTYSVSDYRR